MIWQDIIIKQLDDISLNCRRMGEVSSRAGWSHKLWYSPLQDHTDLVLKDRCYRGSVNSRCIYWHSWCDLNPCKSLEKFQLQVSNRHCLKGIGKKSNFYRQMFSIRCSHLTNFPSFHANRLLSSPSAMIWSLLYIDCHDCQKMVL